jgi:hypothetical protein
MPIILDWTIRSLTDFLERKRQQQAADLQEPGCRKKDKYLVPERPKVCPACSAKESFWVKGYYFRWAVEGELEQPIPVPRYICCCGLVVTVLFAFLVPYRQCTAKAVAEAVQEYLLHPTTYRTVAGEIAGGGDALQRPNHSQVWRWVDLLSGRAAIDLNVSLQRACMTAGKEDSLGGVHQSVCPNADRAQSTEKFDDLNCGARFLKLAEILLAPSENIVRALQAYFAAFVKPARSILTGRAIILFTPQSSQHLIW